MNLGLTKKVAWVTGASKGIGKAIALQLAKEGAHVAISYHSDELGGLETEKEMNAMGSSIYRVQMDLRDRNKIKAVVQDVVQHFGKIDILINNAIVGSQPTKFTSDGTEDLAMIQHNLLGTYQVTKEVVPYMIQQKWGRLVHISSATAEDGMVGTAPYSTYKSALHGLSKTLAKEIAQHQVYSNVIIPGFTLTEKNKHRLTPEQMEQFAQKNPTGRLGTPEDVAMAAVFLASAANRFINGETLRVTGGQADWEL